MACLAAATHRASEVGTDDGGGKSPRRVDGADPGWRLCQRRHRHHRAQAGRGSSAQEPGTPANDSRSHARPRSISEDVDGRFMLVNRSYEDIHRVTKDEDIHRVTKDDVIGKTLDEVFSKERAVEFGASDPEIVEQCRVVGGEERHQLPDGEHILAVMKFPILDPSGEVVAVGGWTWTSPNASEPKRSCKRLTASSRTRRTGWRTSSTSAGRSR